MRPVHIADASAKKIVTFLKSLYLDELNIGVYALKLFKSLVMKLL